VTRRPLVGPYPLGWGRWELVSLALGLNDCGWGSAGCLMVVWEVVRSIVVADRLKSLPSRSMGLAMESPDALVTRQRSGAAENFVSLLNTVITRRS